MISLQPMEASPSPSIESTAQYLQHQAQKLQHRRSRLRLRLSTRPRTVPNSRSTSASSTTSSRRPSLSRRSLSRGLIFRLTAKLVKHSGDESDWLMGCVPETTAFLDNSLPLDFFRQDLLTLVRLLKVSKWHRLALHSQCVEVERILGALTNLIYKLTYSETANDDQHQYKLPALLLRVYGKNADNLIDRERELAVLAKLSQKSIGPRLLGVFGNGRFEQFLEGYNTLVKEEIREPAISQMLGRRMKDLHYKIGLDPHHDYLNNEPMVWRLIHKWLGVVGETYLSTIPNVDETFLMSFDKFKHLVAQYREWLFDHYDRDNICDNFKFCHNDTQYGNLLLHGKYDKNKSDNANDHNLVVIDFEYSGANFSAYDLANHFLEWMADYHDPQRSYFIDETRYPTKAEQLSMIQAYIEYEKVASISNYRLKTKSNDEAITEVQTRQLYNECVIWRASAQIYWCLWGLISYGAAQVKKSQAVLLLDTESAASIYRVTTAFDSCAIGGDDDSDDATVADEAITSVDDDFDYLKYSQQKVALFVGDCIGFGLVDEAILDPRFSASVKRLDCSLYDI